MGNEFPALYRVTEAEAKAKSKSKESQHTAKFESRTLNTRRKAKKRSQSTLSFLRIRGVLMLDA